MRTKMRTFKVEVSSKLIKRQEIWLEEYQGYNYDAVKKHAKKIAEGEIEFMCQKYKAKKEDFKIDFEPTYDKLKISYSNEEYGVIEEKIITIEEC